ncbi:MAG: ExeM/NucH family extracellular endonuclease [Chitinophagaceae bacterium]|nr:ExeM/NucH family extracellular endonuclease [Rubrivivax sp.]
MAMALSCLALAAPAGAAVIISQVYGGGGNLGATFTNDYVELHNSGSTAVSLAGWSLQYASATGTSWTNSTPLSGTIAAGGYFLVRQASGGAAGAALPVTPDVPGTTNMSATAGKLALVNSATLLSGVCPLPNASVVDFVGYGPTASCSETAPAPAPSNSTAIVRASVGNSCQDSGNNSLDFAAATPLPRNSASVPQPCSGGGGGGGGGTPMAAAIYTIQGSGSTGPLAGQRVVTSGVVTKINSNGFFIQDLAGDGNPATSDGIFVFTGGTVYPAAAVGNLVEVTATAVEFATGSGPDTVARPVTELTTVTGVTQSGSGFTISPTPVALPEAVNDDLERYEGMLVTLTGSFTVNQNFFQGRYGQLTLAVGGRLETPTNRHRPGTPQAIALADENARRRILLDDGSSVQNPNPIPYLDASALPRAGYTTGALTGVIDYGLATNNSAGLGDYKIHPTIAPVFSPGNVRTAAPEPVGGNLRVASFNVLNYFTAFTNGTGTSVGCTLGGNTSTGNCRGADNAVEFGRQRTKIVEAMVALQADVLGLMEIQNNGNTAAQDLASALNARVGAGTYVTASLPADTGTDAIRVAIIYKAARLSPVGSAVSDNDPINNRPTLAQTFSLASGERFTVLVNHLKSKGTCPAPGDADAPGNLDSGDGQGCWNLLRTQQAERLRTFVAQRQLASGSNDVLLIGDFNAYGQEDPIHALSSNGYIDELGRFSPFGYSYVFDGAAGRLDHAISTASLSPKVSRVVSWHINADETAIADYNTEFKAPAMTCGLGGTNLCPPDPYSPTPYRSSDHDPVLVGLDLYKRIAGTAGRDTLVGSPGDDIITGGPGADELSGGGGANIFVYTSMRDAGDVITDYAPAKDRLDFGPLLAGLGYSGSNPFADGWVRYTVLSRGATLVEVDADGPAGPAAFRALLTLSGVSLASLVPSRDVR